MAIAPEPARARKIKRIARDITGLMLIFIYISGICLFLVVLQLFQALHPSLFPRYHDNEFTLIIYNIGKSPISVTWLRFDDWSRSRSVRIGTQSESDGKSIRYTAYMFGEAAYFPQVHIEIKYTIIGTERAIEINADRDRSKFWSCAYNIVIDE